MTKEEIKNFSMRISQSNKTQIVVISYEIIINYIDSAIEDFDKGDERGFVHNLQKAQQFVNDLTSALDYSCKISYDLLSLYSFANRCLIHSIAGKKKDNLDSVRNMMDKLRDSFDKISSQDTSGSAMENADTVYAGLTYGREALDEVPAGNKTKCNFSI